MGADPGYFGKERFWQPLKPHTKDLVLEQLSDHLPCRRGVHANQEDDENIDRSGLYRGETQNPVHEPDPDSGEEQTTDHDPKHQHGDYLRFSFSCHDKATCMPGVETLQHIEIKHHIDRPACLCAILTTSRSLVIPGMVQIVKNFTITVPGACQFVKRHVTLEKDLALLRLFGL